MKSFMATFVEIQLKKENQKMFLERQSFGAKTGITVSQSTWEYVIVQIIFLQTDSFMVQWPRVLGTGFPIQVSQV